MESSHNALENFSFSAQVRAKLAGRFSSSPRLSFHRTRSLSTVEFYLSCFVCGDCCAWNPYAVNRYYFWCFPFVNHQAYKIIQHLERTLSCLILCATHKCTQTHFSINLIWIIYLPMANTNSNRIEFHCVECFSLTQCSIKQ